MSPFDEGAPGVGAPERVPRNHSDGSNATTTTAPQLTLDFTAPGDTFEQALDGERLHSAQERVEARADGIARSVAEWAVIGRCSPTGVTARLRQARRRGFVMESKRIAGGLWSYRLTRAA